MFRPKLWSCVREVSSKQFLTDLIAGVVVGIVALPLAMAFGIASGVAPERGLYTAIIAGFLISALGGSRVQIGGPTGAFVVIVFDVVRTHGLDGLAICTLMAGVMLIAMGLARLGAAIKFIPYPVITGFTSGIAVIIFSSQFGDLLGLESGPLPGDLHRKWVAYFDCLETINWTATGLSLLCVALVVVFRRLSPRLPAALIAMLAATVLVLALELQVETIGSRFGGIPTSLPRPEFPPISLERMKELVSPAFTIALLAGIESLLSAVVADGMIGGRHRPNTELIAQGVANIASPIFGGIPATGAIARTATNIKNGARTPIAGIVHALTLLLIMLAFGQWASLVPMCSLAAILVVVAYDMSEWRAFAALLKAPRSDVAILLITFLLTIVVDLTVAVEVGVVLAALTFVKRMSEVTRVSLLSKESLVAGERSGPDGATTMEIITKRVSTSGVEIYDLEGPFCFASADKLRDILPQLRTAPKALVLRLRHVPAIDATGLHALHRFHGECVARNTKLILAGVNPRVMKALRRSHESKVIGRKNIFTDTEHALKRAEEIAKSLPTGRLSMESTMMQPSG
jgi:SulP family sulfate permease